jgi:putative ABC transport system permease protein
MLGLVFQRIWNKKWLFVCLVLGSILLIATAASFPMYRNAVFNRMFQDVMVNKLEDTGDWPMRIHMTSSQSKEEGVEELKRLETLADTIPERLGVAATDTLYYYAVASASAVPDLVREGVEDFSLRISFIRDLEDQIALTEGKFYSETGISEDGCLEALISQRTMLIISAVVGDVYTFDQVTDVNGNPVRVRIVGVYKKLDEEDPFWQQQMNMFTNNLFVREDAFRQMLIGDTLPDFSVTANIYTLFDYASVDASWLNTLVKRTETLMAENRGIVNAPDYLDSIESYDIRRSRINVTLFILEVPILLLLCAFLLMISTQMFELERNDISVLKSRGASRWQIFVLYLMQSSLLAGVSLLAGIPLGVLFCRILGSASNFLEFEVRRNLTVQLTGEVLIFALVAALVAIGTMTLPALWHSKVTIVALKQQKVRSKRSWWEKSFLDLIFLGISLYGYYSYSNNTEVLMESALKDEPLDPLLYVSSALFILGAGMLLLRLQPLFVRILYLLVKRRSGPAIYASTLETLRNGRKQQYIMLFMILTVSLGMFDAVSARTILQNSLNNVEYLDGVDLKFREIWPDNSLLVAMDPSIEFTYYEPDYGRFADWDEFAEYTRVYYVDDATVDIDRWNRLSVSVMGIHTKEFGEITHLNDDLLAQPYHQYLNDLAMTPDGVLLSSNFRDLWKYREGDYIRLTENGKEVYARIVGFFDYWPTYVPTDTTLDASGDTHTVPQYLAVYNYSMTVSKLGQIPYYVWVGMKNDTTTDFFYRWVDSEHARLNTYEDMTEDLKGVVEDPLLQGMNGVLTMSFIVMLVLCAVGYLIYWILSIRSREMMLGVLRAFGMHRAELLMMLINEQIFCGLYSVAAGFGVGTLAYKLYVPMLQMAYSTTSQVLPLEMITQAGDMARLFAVVGMTLAVCLAVLAVLIFRLNITKALKLGEE